MSTQTPIAIRILNARVEAEAAVRDAVSAPSRYTLTEDQARAMAFDACLAMAEGVCSSVSDAVSTIDRDRIGTAQDEYLVRKLTRAAWVSLSSLDI